MSDIKADIEYIEEMIPQYFVETPLEFDEAVERVLAFAEQACYNSNIEESEEDDLHL